MTSSPYNKYFEVTQKEKIEQTTKSKTWWLASSAFLGPSKRRKWRVCRDRTPSDIPSDSDTELAVPLADDSTVEDEEQDADCVFCTGRFSEDHSGEEWIRCAKYWRWAHDLVLVWRKILFVRLVRDKPCVVLSLYPW
jgi:hypothetical protein